MYPPYWEPSREGTFLCTVPVISRETVLRYAPYYLSLILRNRYNV